MFNFLQRPERVIGLLLVLVLHGVVLYGLWRYRADIAPEKVVFLTMLMPLAVQQPPRAEPRQPQPARPHKALPQTHDETPIHLQPEPSAIPAVLMSAAPVAPAITTQEPAQPLTLPGELSVNCPERTPPSYPALSLRLGEQGRVVLRVELDEDGRVSGATVKTHSGFIRLDEAALSAVKTWHCKPARRNGLTVPAVALQPFSFTLEDR